MAHFQTSLAEIGLLPGKATRRAEFFQRLDRLVPWDRWCAIVDAHRAERAGAGRRPVATETMLRMVVVQRALNLSDEECEDQCTDSRALSAFLGAAKVPDKTTLCKFRNWLVAEGVEREIFEDLAAQLEAEGLMMREGSVVDATFVESPSSTKNRERARDPEAHQAKKGNNWHFGHKAHIGADRDSGLVHTVVTTAANVSDISQAKECVRGCDEEVYLDAGYTGLEKRPEAADEGGALHGKCLFIAAKRSTVETEEDRFREHAVSQVRSVVEHPFHYLKDVMRTRRTRYRGHRKNDQMLCMCFAISNLLMLGRKRVALSAA